MPDFNVKTDSTRFTRSLLAATCLLFLGQGVRVVAQGTPVAESWLAEKNGLITKLQVMAHGIYSDQEWQEAFDQIHGLLQQADDVGNHGGVVDLSLLLARVQSDMRQNHTDALYTLSNLKDKYQQRADVAVNRIYVGLAEIYARLGDVDAITSLIEEFTNSARYDPEDYAITGGDNPSTPVRVVRPHAKGDASITVSKMKRLAREAVYSSVGKAFPSFQTDLLDGTTTSLAAYRGKVLLVDCWIESWPTWKNNIPYLTSAYEKYHHAGFEILGVYLGIDMETAMTFARENDMTWPQANDPQALARLVGVMGEATSFLVDQQGRVVDRNPSMPRLVEKIRAQLEVTE